LAMGAGRASREESQDTQKFCASWRQWISRVSCGSRFKSVFIRVNPWLEFLASWR
jgi:hypothetical protein